MENTTKLARLAATAPALRLALRLALLLPTAAGGLLAGLARCC